MSRKRRTDEDQQEEEEQEELVERKRSGKEVAGRIGGEVKLRKEDEAETE